MSTNHFFIPCGVYNLIAVCKNPPIDSSSNKLHCDKERGNKLLVNIVLHENAQVTWEHNHSYFAAYTDGSIVAKHQLPKELSDQVNAFLTILNLSDHTTLKTNRSELLNRILLPFYTMPNHEKRSYLETQFNRIYNNPALEYRQYLLIYMGNKLGIN